MARVTSQQAVEKIGNRYELILIATRRARELNHGWKPHIKCDNNSVVTALREIEEGYVGRDYLFKPTEVDRKRSKD
jgi:DNA-directed RNA polymerase subunit omega